MPFARGDMRDHIVSQKRPRSFVWALRSIAVVESAKNQLLRDFRRRSIFDFCNTIGSIADMVGLAAGSTRSRLTQPGVRQESWQRIGGESPPWGKD
jgi:hypothetical protein